MTGLEAQRLENAVLCAAGHVVLDGSALSITNRLSTPSTGATELEADGSERPYVLVGGPGAQLLAGGAGADVITAGPGDAELPGGPGGDTFLFQTFDDGRVVLGDFSLGEHDVLDFSWLPVVSGASVHSFMRVVQSSGTSELQVDLDGSGSGYTNLVVALPTLSVADADLYTLIDGGFLRVGSLVLDPRITVVASQDRASENGPFSGRFTLYRVGNESGDIWVNIVLGGSAHAGTDYASIPSSVLIPAGSSSVDIEILPFSDSLPETPETVQLLLAAGTGYRVGVANQATVTIEDLLMSVELEVLEPLAVKASGTPAVLLLTRRDLLDRDVLVRLSIGGSATPGTDYTALSTFVLIGANQTSALIYVNPKSTAVLSGGMETVRVTITADAAYRVAGVNPAEVMLVERLDSLDEWQAREFPEYSGSSAVFASQDSGNTGVTHLQRYAFGLDAHSPDRTQLPRATWLNGDFLLSFRQPLGVSDVTYRVSAVSNLHHRAESQLPVERIAAPAEATDPERVYYRIKGDLGSTQAAFILLELEWTP